MSDGLIATIFAALACSALAVGCSSDPDDSSAGDTTIALDTGAGDPSDGSVATSTTEAALDDPDPPPSSTALPTTTVEAPSLEERIAANMQGSQLEYQDVFGDEQFGIVFFHHGDWAVEAIEWPFGSGDHCERATYAWSIVDAVSESEFTIHYDELTEPPDCVEIPGSTRFVAEFTGSREVDGRTIYDFAYTSGLGDEPVTGTRTVCSPVWDEPSPCGLTLDGFELPDAPVSSADGAAANGTAAVSSGRAERLGQGRTR